MNNVSVFLDVALSLTFFYLIASMFVSGITEFFNTIIDKRAALLREALKKLESAWDNSSDGKTFSILQHPLICIFKKSNSNLWKESLSYIHKHTFVSVIVDKLSTTGIAADLNTIKLNIQKLEKTEFQKVLSVIVDESKDIQDFERRLAQWFEHYMVQVTDWYKRYNRIVVWVIAAVVSVALNLDSIIISKRLYTDPVLRESMVNNALNAAKQGNYAAFDRDNRQGFLVYLKERDSNLVDSANRISISSQADSIKVRNLFKKYIAPDTSGIQGRDWISDQFIDTVKVQFPDLVQKQMVLISKTALDSLKVSENYTYYLKGNLSALGLPIGWGSDINGSINLWLRALGWILTTAALSFGAPFWFDMLVKLVNIRNVVKPADTKSEA